MNGSIIEHDGLGIAYFSVDILKDIVDILGTGVPRLACLRPMAWLCWKVYMAHHHQQGIQDPREADDARPPQERPSQAGSRGAEISRRGKPHEALMT